MDGDQTSLVRDLDARYRANPFPGVDQWAELRPSTRLAEALDAWSEAREGVDDELLAPAIEEQVRAAAWDSGAIEGLYRTDVGVTLSIARRDAAWKAIARDAGPGATALFQAQLDGFQVVFDVATGGRDLTPGLLKELHAAITRAQPTYEATDQFGKRFDRELHHGVYKDAPNHGIGTDDEPWYYAPVSMVTDEVDRFIADANSDTFEQLSVDLQASWLHYALVRIHPFSDGNGRVVRALASMPSWRAGSFPLDVRLDQRAPYIAALSSADAHDLQAFASFVGSRMTTTCERLALMARRTRAAGVFSTAAARSRVVRDGLSQAELEATATDLHRVQLAQAARRVVARLPKQIAARARLVQTDVPSGYRWVLDSAPQGWLVELTEPAAASTRALILVAADPPSPDADLFLVAPDGNVIASFDATDTQLAAEMLEAAVEAELVSTLDGLNDER